jgi:serine/threonine protein kinase
MFMPTPSPLPSSPSISFTKCKSSSPPTFGGFSSGWISYYRINYQEIKKLGRGAGGDAFLCRNNIDEDLYAIKKIRTKVSEAARLKEEAVILRHLDHPNIVRYYQSWIEDTPLNEPFDIFEEDELSRSACVANGEEEEEDIQLFIAMEYCPLTLRKAIESGLQDTNNLFYQLVKGVHYIHSKGMMHRDLNPNNIFISNDGNIKIGDFGCSTRSGNDSCRDVGTSYYRAPEIDTDVYDARIDIYALGVIFFEMLYPMSTQMERHEVLQALRKGVFPSGFEENHAIEAQLIRQMLAPNPEERCSTLYLLSALKRKKSGSW